MVARARRTRLAPVPVKPHRAEPEHLKNAPTHADDAFIADLTPARVPDVLVVDDEPDVAALLVTYLHRWECTVRVAYTGEEAVALAQQSPPDVAIVDILLPGIDGWETIEQIRSQSQNHDCRIVTMSIADGQAHPRSFDSSLHKPFVWDDIKRVVQPLLNAGDRR